MIRWPTWIGLNVPKYKPIVIAWSLQIYLPIGRHLLRLHQDFHLQQQCQIMGIANSAEALATRILILSSDSVFLF